MPWGPDILQDAFTFERVVVTPYTFAIFFGPAAFSYYVMSVLVQLPRTALYRAALLPVIYWMNFRATASLDMTWNHPRLILLNKGLAIGMFILAMRCMAWVFAQRPYARLPTGKSENATVNGHKENINIPAEDGVSLSSAMWNACDLVANFRLMGWNEHRKMYIAEPTFRIKSPFLFALYSLCRLIFLLLGSDAMSRILRLLGPDTFGAPQGSTILDPSLPPLQRYIRSTMLSPLVVAAIYGTIYAFYQLSAVLMTILFRQCPSRWPPLFDSPWLSTSLSQFWGRRWHQLFRECFEVLGRVSLERFFGPFGVVMTAFIVSGIMHDVALRGLGRGGDTIRVGGFFLVHGVGVVMEYVWKRATGKRVGGVIGWLWMVSFFLLTGNPVTDAWARRGLLAADFWPEAYSPTAFVLNRTFQNRSL